MKRTLYLWDSEVISLPLTAAALDPNFAALTYKRVSQVLLAKVTPELRELVLLRLQRDFQDYAAAKGLDGFSLSDVRAVSRLHPWFGLFSSD